MKKKQLQNEVSFLIAQLDTKRKEISTLLEEVTNKEKTIEEKDFEIKCLKTELKTLKESNVELIEKVKHLEVQIGILEFTSQLSLGVAESLVNRQEKSVKKVQKTTKEKETK